MILQFAIYNSAPGMGRNYKVQSSEFKVQLMHNNFCYGHSPSFLCASTKKKGPATRSFNKGWWRETATRLSDGAVQIIIHLLNFELCTLNTEKTADGGFFIIRHDRWWQLFQHQT